MKTTKKVYAKDISNKDRLLKVLEVFSEESDEENSIVIKVLREKLKLALGENFNVEKRSLLDDIHTLQRCGYDIIENDGPNNQKEYYISRIFEVHELRLLIDAVSSARSITTGETKKIIDKIKRLTSKPHGKKLQNYLYISDTVKCEESIALSVDKIHTAISNKTGVQFQYGNYTVDKEFKLHRGKNFYTVDPYELAWNNDFYYLVGKDTSKDKIIHFRVDRMRNVKYIDFKTQKGYFNIGDHLKSCFNMYPGEKEVIDLQFNNGLINVIIDRFGTGINIKKINDTTFSIRIDAAINEGLIRWLLTWGSDVKIIKPQSLVEAVKQEINKMFNVYK